MIHNTFIVVITMIFIILTVTSSLADRNAEVGDFESVVFDLSFVTMLSGIAAAAFLGFASLGIFLIVSKRF